MIKFSGLMLVALVSSLIAALNWIIVYYLINKENNDNAQYYVVLLCLTYTMFDSLLNIFCLSFQFSINDALYRKFCCLVHKCLKKIYNYYQFAIKSL